MNLAIFTTGSFVLARKMMSYVYMFANEYIYINSLEYRFVDALTNGIYRMEKQYKSATPEHRRDRNYTIYIYMNGYCIYRFISYMSI